MDFATVVLVALIGLNATNILALTFLFGSRTPVTYKVGVGRWFFGIVWSVAVIVALIQVMP